MKYSSVAMKYSSVAMKYSSVHMLLEDQKTFNQEVIIVSKLCRSIVQHVNPDTHHPSCAQLQAWAS
jgi:hypothetical protein